MSEPSSPGQPANSTMSRGWKSPCRTDAPTLQISKASALEAGASFNMSSMVLVSSVAARSRRISVIISRTAQFCRSGQVQSSPCCSAAHGTSAIGPSRVRITSPIVISAAGLRRLYPPPTPRLLLSKPACRSERRICSRNFTGMFSRVLNSWICQDFGCRAIATSARRAYSALREIRTNV
jgi:hypothetical protein